MSASRKPFVWSHSSLNEYDTCPHRFYRKRVVKDVPDPPGEAALAGTAVHKQVEEYIMHGGMTPLNLPTYKVHADRLLTMRKNGWNVDTEKRLVFTKALTPSDYGQPGAWGVAIADVLAWRETRALVVDWKNGKYRPDTGADQAARNAIATFAHLPRVNTVTTTFIYPNANKSTVLTFEREKIDEYLKPTLTTLARVEASFATGGWPVTPNGLCRAWCPVVDCPHNGKFKLPVVTNTFTATGRKTYT